MPGNEKQIKKILGAALALITILANFAFFKPVATAANAWTAVGSPGFSAGVTQFPSMDINASSTPYVIYEDITNGDKATVMKYNGSAWTAVGSPGFSAGAAEYTTIKINPGTQAPYIAYRDYGASGKATVQTFNGSAWVNVGSPGFSVGSAEFESLAFTSTSTPYIAYRDDGLGSGTAVVKTFNGSSWVTVGSPGFSAGAVRYTSLALDSNDTPYVAYEDIANGNKVTVMKYNGSSWVAVGSAGFSPTATGDEVGLAISSTNVPYIVYDDAGNNQKMIAMKYNGTAWVLVGSQDFSDLGASYISFKLDHADTPYVSYLDINGITVMKYNGSAWVSAGAPAFALGTYTSLAFDASNKPYVVFSDTFSSNKTTVMALNGFTLNPTLSFPNNSSTIISYFYNSFEYNIPEAMLSGSLTLTFTPSSGPANVIHLVDVSPGANSVLLLPSGGIQTAGGVDSATYDNLPDGTYTVTISYRDAAGDPPATASATGVVIITPTAPSPSPTPAPAQGGAVDLSFIAPHQIQNTAFSINNGTKTTNSPGVTLNISAGSDVKSMAVSNTAGFDGIGIEPLSSSKPWTLCSQCAAGNYTVYLKLYNTYGQSVTLQQNITYDPKATSGKTMAPAVTGAVSPNSGSFQTVLRLGINNSDVLKLQQYLNSHGFLVAASGPGSPGNETAMFGRATQKALMAFQKAHTNEILAPAGLANPTGIFGNMTIAYINSHP